MTIYELDFELKTLQSSNQAAENINRWNVIRRRQFNKPRSYGFLQTQRKQRLI